MRTFIVVVIIAGIHWLVTVGLMLAELDTGGLLGVFPTRGHDVVVGLLKAFEFPLLTIYHTVFPDYDTLLLPVMIVNSLLWAAVIYWGFWCVRRWKMSAVLALIAVLNTTGCGSVKDNDRDGRVSRSQALALAVQLANERCLRQFSHTPFDSSTCSIEFEKGRWRWGSFDLAGADGFSALVSFDADGNDPDVEVFFSTDVLEAIDEPDARPR